MAASDDVNFGDRVVFTLPYLFQDVRQRQFESEGIALFLAEGAEATAVDTNIGIIDVLIQDIIGGISMKTGPDCMSQGTERCDITAGKEFFPVFQVQALASLDLSIDVSQSKILVIGDNQTSPSPLATVPIPFLMS